MTFRDVYTILVNYRKIIAIITAIITLSGIVYKVVISPRLEVKSLQEIVDEQKSEIILKDVTILIKDFNNTRDHADRSVYEVNLTRPNQYNNTNINELSPGGYTIGL